MGTTTSSQANAVSIFDLCDQAEISDKARQYVKSDMSPGALLGKLVDAELFTDVVKLVSHALPKRDAIWWACLCIEMVSTDHDPPAEIAALKSAVQWVLDPSEQNRQKAAIAAEQAPKKSPTASLAHAVQWTSGSMSRPGLPVVEPKPEMTPNAIVAAVRAASNRGDRSKKTHRVREFLRLAVEVAEGRHHWAEAKSGKGAR